MPRNVTSAGNNERIRFPDGEKWKTILQWPASISDLRRSSSFIFAIVEKLEHFNGTFERICAEIIIIIISILV